MLGCLIGLFTKSPEDFRFWAFRFTCVSMLFRHVRLLFRNLSVFVQNTIGWYFVGSVCYSWMIYVHELRHGSSAGLRGPTWWKVSWYTALPPAVALECTSCFYALFPAHPFAVKAVSMVYLSLVFGLAVVVYKSTKTKIARCK